MIQTFEPLKDDTLITKIYNFVDEIFKSPKAIGTIRVSEVTKALLKMSPYYHWGADKISYNNREIKVEEDNNLNIGQYILLESNKYYVYENCFNA